jgi:hypothetical protein
MRNEVDLVRVHAVDFHQHIPSTFRHHDEAVRKQVELLHHHALVGVRLAQHGVQGRDHGFVNFPEEGQQMAASRPSKDPKLVLHRHDLDVVNIEEFSRTPVRVDLLFVDFKTHALRVIVALGPIVDRTDNTLGVGKLGRHRLADVGGKRGNAAAARQVIADEGDVFGIRRFFHVCKLLRFRTPQTGSGRYERRQPTHQP